MCRQNDCSNKTHKTRCTVYSVGPIYSVLYRSKSSVLRNSNEYADFHSFLSPILMTRDSHRCVHGGPEHSFSDVIRDWLLLADCGEKNGDTTK